MAGENDIDFSFEELEFITGDLGDLEGTEEGTEGNPNETVETEEEIAAKLAAEKEKKEKGVSTPEEEAARLAAEKEVAEGVNPEGVGDGSTDGDKGDGKGTSPQLYQTLATVLKEQGVFICRRFFFRKSKDVDGLIEIIKSQIEAEEYKDLTDVQKAILKDMREGVSDESASVYKKSMDQLQSITDDIINNDKQVRFDLIYQDFIAKGFDSEKAKKYANRSFELKEDIVDAKEAKSSLENAVTTRYENSKQKDIQKADAEKKKIQENKEALKDKILKSKEIIKGVEVSEKLRNEVYEEMSKTVSTNPVTGIPENSLMKYQRENPVDFSHKLYYLYKVTNGFSDFAYFQGKKTSNSVKALETALKQSTHVSGGGDPSFADDGEAHSLDIGELVLPE